MQDESTPAKGQKPRKNLSGAERRRRRQAQGLPPYAPYNRAAKTRNALKALPVRRAARTALVRSIKLERGCADCGYNAHPAALDFDHLPEFQKIMPIAYIHEGRSLEFLLSEIAKCEVVCANCHRIRTYERREAAKHND